MTMKQNEKPISTGFPSADELLGGGLRCGELVCLAGPQTAANTRFICRAALAAAEQTEKTVLLVSLCASEKAISETMREYGAEESLLKRITVVYNLDLTVEALEKRVMADDTVGTVLIDGGEWIDAFCEGSRWPPEYCLYCDMCCDKNESMKSCNVYALKKLAQAFNLPVAVTQTIPETEVKNRAALGISPETDRLLFLRCDGQTWQFRAGDENEAASPLSEPVAQEQKSPPDLLRFIPSKDVREHLKTISWQPDAVQAALLVLGNDTVPLYEKLEVLRQITETLPDVLLDLPSFVENGETLHECLLAYVRDEEELLASFPEGENAAFLAEVRCGEHRSVRRSVMGTDLDVCLKKALDVVPDDRRSSWHVHVSKYDMNHRYAFSVTFNADRQPIHRTGVPNRKAEEIRELLREPFTLPHPFRRFDLVWLPRGSDENYMICRTPILLDSVPDPAAATSDGRQGAAGYYIGGGALLYVSGLPVADLEFLPIGAGGQETEILSELRDYLSGKIPVRSFANSFAAFCMRSAAEYVSAPDSEPDEPTSPVPPVSNPFPVGDDDLPF